MLNRGLQLPLLLLLWTPALAGCLASSQEPAQTNTEETRETPAWARPSWNQFHAIYHDASGSTLTLDLRPGIHEVMARDREPQQAHRLDTQRTDDTYGTWNETYYLDAQARIIRVDVPCLQAPECAYAHVDWSTQGLPAPYGLWALHGIAPDHALEYTVHGIPYKVEVTLQNGLLIVPPHETPIPLDARLGGVFGYTSDTPLATTLEQNDHHGQRHTWILSESSRGPPLPALEPRTLKTQDLTPAPRGIPQGFDSPLSPSNTTPQDALDWLVSQDPAGAGEALASGCLQRFRMEPPWKTADPLDPLVGIQARQQLQFTIQSPQSPDKAPQRWTVEVAFHKDGSRTYSQVGDPTKDGDPIDCDALSPRLGPDLQTLDAFAQGLPLSVDHDDARITLETGRPLPAPWTRPLGTEFVRIFFRPDWVPADSAFIPYGPLFDLQHGWLYSMDLHPDDLARMDATLRPHHEKP